MDWIVDSTSRSALPPEYRVLLKDFPRDSWRRATGPFTAFYLERHELFRRITGVMIADTEAYLDGAPPVQFKKRLMRHGGVLLEELEAHHKVEDDYYFPRIMQLDKRVIGAFDLMEQDHTSLDINLDRLCRSAESALQASARDDRFIKAEHLLKDLQSLETLLLSHLADEEDIVVPLLLKYGEGAIEA